MTICSVVLHLFRCCALIHRTIASYSTNPHSVHTIRKRRTWPAISRVVAHRRRQTPDESFVKYVCTRCFFFPVAFVPPHFSTIPHISCLLLLAHSQTHQSRPLGVCLRALYERTCVCMFTTLHSDVDRVRVFQTCWWIRRLYERGIVFGLIRCGASTTSIIIPTNVHNSE